MSSITLDGVSKVHRGGHAAVNDVSLTIADGELMVLVGPSGCGKSTLLRLIAGLDTPTTGRILLDGHDVTGLPPQQRDLAMVFQSYALYPHLTVRDNLSYGLRMRRMSASDIARRVDEAAATLGIASLLGRRPAELSGGQRQRVALGRAIVREPRAFLLDEPLSNLDARLRAETRTELAVLLRRLRATMVYVTHDQEEAMTLGARIAVMRDGAIAQAGPPLEVYRRPASVFVAGFVGSPAMNLIPGTFTPRDGRPLLHCGTFVLPLEDQAPALPHEGIRELVLGVRPTDLDLVAEDGADVVGPVEVVEPLGSATLMHVRAGEGGPLVRLLVPSDKGLTVGQQAAVRLHRDRLHLFDRASGLRLA